LLETEPPVTRTRPLDVRRLGRLRYADGLELQAQLVADRQADHDEEATGPATRVAFDTQIGAYILSRFRGMLLKKEVIITDWPKVLDAGHAHVQDFFQM
jgi:hypothetical protein